MSLENGLTERKRHKQMRIRDYRGKTCLSTENVARIGENAFSERKRDKQVKAWLGKAETPLQNENVTRNGENAFTELTKAKMRIPSQNVSPLKS